jgi:hypothetical protein
MNDFLLLETLDQHEESPCLSADLYLSTEVIRFPAERFDYDWPKSAQALGS